MSVLEMARKVYARLKAQSNGHVEAPLRTSPTDEINELDEESRDLPEFVVLVSGTQPSGGKSCWGTGFLPTRYQGVEFRAGGEPVLFVSNPDGVDAPSGSCPPCPDMPENPG